MVFRLFIILATGFLIGTPALAQELVDGESGGELPKEQAVYRVHFYDMDLKIDPRERRISGSVGIHARMVHPSKTVLLDLDPRFTVHEVSLQEQAGDSLNNVSLRTERSDESRRMRVHLPETFQPGSSLVLNVSYEGVPRVSENPPWDGGFVWSETPDGKPWIGVATQTLGAWTWWPNKDHPSDKPDSVAIGLTLPEELEVASNGRLRGKSTPKEGWTRWQWFSSSPISPYNVTMNAGPFERLERSYESVTGEAVELIVWVLSDQAEKAREWFPQVKRQLRFFEELLGPYPFRHEKFGVVHAPFLGMEHQTLLAYGAGFRNDALFETGSGFDDLLQHEMAHEWWGNMVSVSDWRDFWIHEGFGTYMQALYAEHLGGTGAYRRMMSRFRGHIRSEQPMVPREPTGSQEMYKAGLGADVYYKGAWFLHTLRYHLGDEQFFESLRRFAYPDPELEKVTDGRQVRYVTSDDFLAVVNRVAGESLDGLFEVYLRQNRLPRLNVEQSDGCLHLKWEVSGEIDFPLAVEVDLNGERQTLMPERNRMSLEIPDPDARVRIDPDRKILMEPVDP